MSDFQWRPGPPTEPGTVVWETEDGTKALCKVTDVNNEYVSYYRDEYGYCTNISAEKITQHIRIPEPEKPMTTLPRRFRCRRKGNGEPGVGAFFSDSKSSYQYAIQWKYTAHALWYREAEIDESSIEWLDDE